MTDYNLTTLRAFIPYAERELSRFRWWWRILGALMLLLGCAGCGLLLAIAMTDPRTMMRDGESIRMVGVILFVLAVLPGALLFRQGFARADAHPLIRALAGETQRITEVRYAYGKTLEGDNVLMAMVELGRGRLYEFSLPNGFDERELHERRQVS